LHRVTVLYEQYFGVGSIPWSPLAHGVLTRTPAVKTKRSETDGYVNVLLLRTYRIAYSPRRFINIYAAAEGDATNPIVERVGEIAKKKNISMAQVSLAWLLSKDGALSCLISVGDPLISMRGF